MKKLTKGQRFALAREARRLAMECVEGTAPGFDVDSYCGCAVGVIIYRAIGRRVLPSYKDNRESYELAKSVDEHLPDRDGLGVVSRALQSQRVDLTEQREAVVFPLLALADALEMSAADASKTPKEAVKAVP